MTRLGEYELEGEIARGGAGVVYRARDLRLNREVAIKVLLAASGRSDVKRRRFQEEARALARLNHPNIVTIHAVEVSQGRPYLVMDLVAGKSLQDRLDHGVRFPDAKAAEITCKLAGAMGHAHDLGVLHRDIKPGNVLLTEEGEPLLTDFGLAKVLDASMEGPSVTGQFMGTPGYWPPEQARGDLDRIGPHSDVYALGATLFAMLTGEPPFTGNTLIEVLRDMDRSPPSPSPPPRLGARASTRAWRPSACAASSGSRATATTRHPSWRPT